MEGANLFLTNAARAKLAEQGCVIVKDSSANKCGVICSSFEIMSSMVLDKEEFISIKPALVAQVLDKLRNIARKEAELLMTEYRRNTSSEKGVKNTFNLVNVSIEISQAINRTTDCVRAKLEDMVAAQPTALEPYMPLVQDFLPAELVTRGWDVFEEKVPQKYIVNLVSTILACELVYNEGVAFVNGIKDDKVLTDTAIKYIEEKNVVQSLTRKMKDKGSLSEEDARIITKLLEIGGARAALSIGGARNA